MADGKCRCKRRYRIAAWWPDIFDPVVNSVASTSSPGGFAIPPTDSHPENRAAIHPSLAILISLGCGTSPLPTVLFFWSPPTALPWHCRVLQLVGRQQYRRNAGDHQNVPAPQLAHRPADSILRTELPLRFWAAGFRWAGGGRDVALQPTREPREGSVGGSWLR